MSESIHRRSRGDDPLSQKLLAGQSPRERAAAVIAGTKLIDVDARKELAAGGTEAIDNSKDPLVELARTLEPEYRRLDEVNNELEEMERQAYGKISQAQFAIQGDSVYPDATFTLRLAMGVVKGYSVDGEAIPARTTMGGAFEHAARMITKDPWVLPKSWQAGKEQLDPQTPFNFVCTADIIGGNSEALSSIAMASWSVLSSTETSKA